MTSRQPARSLVRLVLLAAVFLAAGWFGAPLQAAVGVLCLTALTLASLYERPPAEGRLPEPDDLYRTLVENLEQAVFLKDRAGRYRAVNRPFCQTLGVPEVAVLGKTDADLLPPERASRSAADDDRVLNQGQRLEAEDETVCNGRPRVVRVVKSPLRDAEGRIAGVLGIAWDVTEERSLEAQRRHAQKMEAIGQLAGGVAHDFNNLLTAILGNVSLIAGGLPEGDPNRPLAAAAEAAALRAATLTGQLLGFARRTLLRPQPLRLDALAGETAALLRHTFDPRVAIQVRTPPEPWLVLADANQMNQVLMNLCVNARDALPNGGRLLVQVGNVVLAEGDVRGRLEARPGEFVRLRVADTGHGMPPEVRERIFEPFFTTREQGQGNGLGLAVVFGVVKQHHGWIECHSQPGQGTRFDVYLPRHHPDTPAVPPAPAPARGGTETVLLVEDEPMLRTLGRAILEQRGYRVVVAEDGAEAVRIYGQMAKEIDLVLLDLTAPQRTGTDALQELLRLDPDVRVLLASSSADPPVGDAGHPRVFGLIAKPYRPEELAAAVRAALDKAGQRSGFAGSPASAKL
jgi:PAS domain S-box-containing protein